MGVCIGHNELGAALPSYMKIMFVPFSLKGGSTFDATLACRDGPGAVYEYTPRNLAKRSGYCHFPLDMYMG